MIYAIISDIHANSIALSSVLNDARKHGARKIICLGDVVGYGPEPELVSTAIRIKASVALAGNHDDAVSKRIDGSDFIDIAADAIARHREALSEENLKWLKGLQYVYSGKSFSCAHGDFTSPKSFNYISSEKEAAANFSACNAQLMFVGHTHEPGIFLTGASGKIYTLAPTDFTIEEGKRYIVNPGSVGYPRTDGNVCESTYVLYDDGEKTVTFRRIPFTVRSVMQTGKNPRRIKKRTVIAIAFFAAATAVALTLGMAASGRTGTVAPVHTNHVTKIIKREIIKISPVPQTDKTEKIILFSTDRKVKVEVKLSKNSPPAHLQLQFCDDNGKILREERWTAKKSKKTTVSIPKNSASALLTAGRTTGEKPAVFDIFSLTAK
ncbi:MAG: metallophosphoesterase family protein [Kiritimatiellae bacterium]|nr:metallophosphoesterase family protein [Kiritimatiellia bacterium]